MTTPPLERLTQYCQRLRLYQVEAELPTLLDQAAKRDLAYSDFLDEVLGLECRSKQEQHLAMRIRMARFPFQKTLEGFEWKLQPSIDPKVIKELATGRFLADGENVLLLGPPGVGKTHCEIPGDARVLDAETRRWGSRGRDDSKTHLPSDGRMCACLGYVSRPRSHQRRPLLLA